MADGTAAPSLTLIGATWDRPQSLQKRASSFAKGRPQKIHCFTTNPLLTLATVKLSGEKYVGKPTVLSLV
ncbi:MAG TPA: hypothetical protein VGD98_01330 [Ktedonobacteraceae bacterium]